MAKIKVRNGLHVPIEGEPSFKIEQLSTPSHIGINLNYLKYMKLKPILSVGDSVKIGQEILFDKHYPERKVVSPASGIIEEIRRGYRRSIDTVVIKVDQNETYFEHPTIELSGLSRKMLIEYFLKTGLFAHLFQRPFGQLAHPQKIPKSIFIRGENDAPFSPPSYLRLLGKKKEFVKGIEALKILSPNIHLIQRREIPFPFLDSSQNLTFHTVEGNYPACNLSVSIQAIDPIEKADDFRWTLDALDVVVIGKMILSGKYLIDRIIAVGGPMIQQEHRKLYHSRTGSPIQHLLEEKTFSNHNIRYISGDPFTGTRVKQSDFLGFYDSIVCSFEEISRRKPLHFMRLKNDSYTATRTYTIPRLDRYFFTTSKHGESRTFIDPSIYDQVTPLKISVIHLIKALLAQDYETAEKLGLFEIVPEDFALATFICPSKIEFMEIVETEMQNYLNENLVE